MIVRKQQISLWQ